ncbi:MAG TPA: CarD family transcriptional regulator [Syntrophomonadaceae bacterium]|jgi:CarD family transcriptional regulator|nr:CarD family transcriptional regulator [Syntrophomonadaceae bacterium]
MFKVNDYIVYGLTGVCQITDIAKDEISNNETEYYVLNPISNKNLTIKIPVGNRRVAMRPIITKDDIAALIESIPETDNVWVGDERQRSISFKTALKSGKNEELIKIVRTLHLEKEAKSMAGKKLTKTDEDIMNIAEKQLSEEFAVALDISPDEVLPYILEHIPKTSDIE